MADFTKEQTLAITTLDRNVSVSAGAGSGKTRVLVERFLTILKDPDKSANRILAITFTLSLIHILSGKATVLMKILLWQSCSWVLPVTAFCHL